MDADDRTRRDQKRSQTRETVVERQILIEDEVNLRELFGVLWRYRISIAVIIAATIAVAGLYILFATPIYRVEVLLAPAAAEESQDSLAALPGRLGGVAALAGLSQGSTSKKDESIAILRSRRFTSEFIEQHGLMPILFQGAWDRAAKDWKKVDPADIPTISDAVKLFDEEIRTVTEDNKTQLIKLQIEWNDRYLAANWANALVRSLNQHIRHRDIAEANRSIEYLNAELENTNVIEIRQGVFRLIERQIEAAMLANVRTEYAFRILDPAVAPDEDQYAWPDKRLLLVVAFGIGVILSIGVAAIRSGLSN